MITANTRAHRRYWPEVGPDVPLTSPVPQRPAGPYCPTCGNSGAHWAGCPEATP